MVVALGPGRFYGSSLPRPRIYADVKLSEERVDPPLPVSAAFLSWATEAHWSMGGLSLKRHRLQGRIEGNVKKLRAEKERAMKKKKEDKAVLSPPFIDSPPPLTLDPTSPDEGDKVASQVIRRRKRARKLGDEFDKEAYGLRSEIEMAESGEKVLRSKAEDKAVLSPPFIHSPPPLTLDPTSPDEGDKVAAQIIRRRKRARKLGEEFDKEAYGLRREIEMAESGEKVLRSKAAECDLESRRSSTRRIRKRKVVKSPSPDPSMATMASPIEKEASDTNAKIRKENTRGLKEALSRITDKKWKGGRKGISIDFDFKILAAATRVTRSGREVARVTRSSSKVFV